VALRVLGSAQSPAELNEAEKGVARTLPVADHSGNCDPAIRRSVPLLRTCTEDSACDPKNRASGHNGCMLFFGHHPCRQGRNNGVDMRGLLHGIHRPKPGRMVSEVPCGLEQALQRSLPANESGNLREFGR
jgi:hypothetical protein